MEVTKDQCTEGQKEEVLKQVPQQPPFRFIDRIVELSNEHIITERRFCEDEYFYAGHFPGDPVTPGVLLIETMAQAGLVALGLYLSSLENGKQRMRTLFVESTVEFLEIVAPGELVTVYGKKVFFRRNKLKTQVELKKENGQLAAHGLMAGVGVVIEN